jgi:hypothetical protein
MSSKHCRAGLTKYRFADQWDAIAALNSSPTRTVARFGDSDVSTMTRPGFSDPCCVCTRRNLLAEGHPYPFAFVQSAT